MYKRQIKPNGAKGSWNWVAYEIVNGDVHQEEVVLFGAYYSSREEGQQAASELISERHDLIFTDDRLNDDRIYPGWSDHD